ncbi:response regulator [Rhodoferax sp. U11-2br]|uniref:response regulator n=1 Tax=Rhodoferax sp. U11-2br TaxID=2838878 RepID=UPI001BE990D3|nr:response regulator [Rhodoferax sp. U11-2br]MBT3066680.1 response regulator [Rhodoferax sp. U11-2br]
MSTVPIQLPSPLRFLVVDDSRAIQAIVRRAILRCGYSPIEVETALDGEQALDLIASFKPDLVITDWHMPKVSGLEMVQALRQLGHQDVRVGFVTTERTPALLEEAISNGALFILHKPFDDAELVAVVANAVKDLVGGAPATLDGVAASPLDAASALLQRRGEDPISHAAMQLLLLDRLGNIPFRLIPHEKMTLEALTSQNLLGLYAANEVKGVYAIGVMDANAVCMVGGGAARMLPNEVRALMASGQPSAVMMDKANEFLRAAAVGLSESAASPVTEVTMAKASVVKNSFAKLATVLAQPGQRSDFRLAIPGYGEGRMAFFVMTS